MAAAFSNPAEALQGPGDNAPAAKRRRTGTAGSESASPLTVVVNGIGGPRCTLEASTEWTILMVHEAILEKINVPVDWQKLIHGTEEVAWEVILSSLMVNKSVTLQLTLVVEEVPEPKRRALVAAIERHDEAAALQLLRRHRLPGAVLNYLHYFGYSVLDRALYEHLPEVALAILSRADFSEINAKPKSGSTALHTAAAGGFLPICRAILDRDDFTELLTEDGHGITASQVADENGHHEVRDFLRAAEARLREARK